MIDTNTDNWRAQYPFDSHYLDMPYGMRMHYVDEQPSKALLSQGIASHTDAFQTGACQQSNLETSGPETAVQPPCILAVHGNPTWSFYYRALIDAMRTSHRVLAPDHIGCGRSAKPQHYAYCLQTHTDNLVNWIEALDLERIVMVVHDWGGAIGLGAALRCMDRMAGLVVLNTGAFPPPYVPWRIAACRLPWVGSWAIRHRNAFARAATVMAIHRQKRLSTAACEGLLAPYDSPENRIGIDTFVKDIPLSPMHRSYRVLQMLDLQLPKLRPLPIRLVWGMQDWCFRPQCLARFQAAWPEASVRTLHDVGHYVMEDAPEEVIEEVRSVLRSSGGGSCTRYLPDQSPGPSDQH